MYGCEVCVVGVRWCMCVQGVCTCERITDQVE